MLFDESDDVDLFTVSAVAETVIDAILDEALDPVAIGVSGVRGAVAKHLPAAGGGCLKVRNLGSDKADPHRVHRSVAVRLERQREGDPASIKAKLADQETRRFVSSAMAKAKQLAKRVQWAKGLMTLQLPNIDDLSELIAEPDDEGEGLPRGLDQFRAEFEELITRCDALRRDEKLLNNKWHQLRLAHRRQL